MPPSDNPTPASTPDTARTPRQRYRAQVQQEIKQAALAQIAAGGIEALSINAIAKTLGMSGPALYKYFRNRDDLLTVLISDGYEDAAEAIRTAAHRVADRSPRARLLALAHAYRDWALAQPHRYLLLAGTPAAAYEAPAHTTDSARAVMGPFVAVLAEGEPWPAAEPLYDEVRAWVTATPAVTDWIATYAPKATDPVPALAASVLAWTRMHGIVSLEVQGNFGGMGHDAATLLDLEMGALADAVGLAGGA
ncbi:MULTISPECIES: TetR/AcrR family transcriptional regulator [Streptomyces]|uniref:TetR/AcrR family transcriptional regulator n=2 Tax=Streptomyces rimosus subsp. rimosus TaxID=132474 RepID=L8F0E6_STRR1|nr:MULTISPECIES: TetR/AcrR family transcriptional regulator [Streptomyces]KOG71602.1 TetR family transcriptional regulator [Kitasatospora aureofaciens]MYT48172.1 TetR family transcriptional regulator [Streptomyces sp. SID5471]KEF21071.1 TetR family transcriptional regulator [Streptomyces rimosus]KOT34399.1 TetR family transcriptional regulator [Streptomyces sp. NRRL WC-3701]KOT34806.1 TetR family transcriptional regulator [Streptomyces rimosus subsp. rimosus]